MNCSWVNFTGDFEPTLTGHHESTLDSRKTAPMDRATFTEDLASAVAPSRTAFATTALETSSEGPPGRRFCEGSFLDEPVPVAFLREGLGILLFLHFAA